MKKTVTALVVATILPLLGSCSSSGSGDYCALIRDDETIKNMDPADQASITRVVDTLRKIEAAAPTDIKPEWTKFRQFMEAVANKDYAAISKLGDMQGVASTIQGEVLTTCNIKITNF